MQLVERRFRRPCAKAVRSCRVAAFLVTLACVLLHSLVQLAAQDLDLVLYAGDPDKRTLIDQIEDPGERDAFQAVKDATDQARKLALAEEFLERFPRSWLVGFAHSMAAMACISLDNFQGALEHGRRSLRFLPENGTLLVSLANVQVHQGLLADAEAGATDALEYLSRFRRPAHYSKSEWTAIKRDLEASAHFVLGRVAATRGLRASGDEGAAQLGAARESLRRSVRMNPADSIAVYLLGIVEEALGNGSSALSLFARAARTPGPVQNQATAKVWSAHRSSSTQARFDEFLAGIPAIRLGGPVGEGLPSPRKDSSARYAGSEVCRDCHEAVFDAWSATGMARMFRSYEHGNVIGDFEDNNEFRDAAGNLLSRMIVEDGRHYFELRAGEGTKRYRVDYTIGSKWQQAYATRLPNGRIHVVPIQYNRLHGRWVNFWEVLDDGKSERSRVREFHRMRNLTSYQVHCSPCHTSQTQAEGALIEPERITFREAGINCEMCHGPSWGHSEAMREGRPEPDDPDAPPLRFGSLDHRAYVGVCAQCHMQSGIVETGPRGEINYSGKQEVFQNERLQRPYEEYSRKAFYKDGRFRETTFIAEAFMRTECFRRGEAHCGHCHDPHPADSATNPTSLKFRNDPDRMCLQCHQALASDPEAHTKHPASSEASRCDACHMPKIMNSMMFMAGTHRIDDIPDASMTERFGGEESPNACLACHTDKPLPWVADLLADW